MQASSSAHLRKHEHVCPAQICQRIVILTNKKVDLSVEQQNSVVFGHTQDGL